MGRSNTAVALVLLTASLFLLIEETAAFVVRSPPLSRGAHSPLSMAGFGGGGPSKAKGGRGGRKKSGAAAPPPKLRPKSQWDRYCDALKKAAAVPVAVRVVGREDGGAGEWLEIGRVKSEGDEYTELAVAMQRGIIAEHAKRHLPLQVLPKDTVEWGYKGEGDDWILVSKDICADAPAGIERRIGFEGLPDPATGFYCHYKEGRLVDKSDEGRVVARG